MYECDRRQTIDRHTDGAMEKKSVAVDGIACGARTILRLIIIETFLIRIRKGVIYK